MRHVYERIGPAEFSMLAELHQPCYKGLVVEAAYLVHAAVRANGEVLGRVARTRGSGRIEWLALNTHGVVWPSYGTTRYEASAWLESHFDEKPNSRVSS